MLLTLICAFGAALPASLGQSFYPLYVTHLGYGEELAAHIALLALLVGLTGFGAGTLDILYRTLASAMSHAENRASALAMGGLVDLWGYAGAFLAFGLALLGLVALNAFLYRRLQTLPTGTSHARAAAAPSIG